MSNIVGFILLILLLIGIPMLVILIFYFLIKSFEEKKETGIKNIPL